MATDVIMPQMGESIAEGTITKWMKKVGDTVQRDEPIFEISTDKVDAEIPSPVAGTLIEIRVPEGQTVAINTVVARIGEAAEAALSAEGSAKARSARADAPEGRGPEARCPGAAAQARRAGARSGAETRGGPGTRRPARPTRLPPEATSSPSRSASGRGLRLSFARSPPSMPWTSARSRAPASITA